MHKNEMVSAMAKGFVSGFVGGFTSVSVMVVGLRTIQVAVCAVIPNPIAASIIINVLAFPLGFASAAVGGIVADGVGELLDNIKTEENELHTGGISEVVEAGASI